MKTQIAALQSRIGDVTAAATPEDLVMLAKAIESVSGQATVFDILDAGTEAGEEALALIDTAKKSALAEIVKASGITDALKAEHAALRSDVDGLLDRTDLTSLPLPPGGTVLPDPAQGVYVLTPADHTGASVILPDYAAGTGALKSHLLVNNADMAIRVLDAAGHALGTVPARGFSLAFAVESAGVWSWRVSQSEPGSQSLIIDSPLLLLDNAATTYLSALAMNGGFLATWLTGSTINACFLRWEGNALKPDPVRRFPGFPGDGFQAVKLTETSALLAWRYTSEKAIKAAVLALGEDGSWSLGSPVVVHTMTTTSFGYFSVAMESGSSGLFIVGDQDTASPANYFAAAQRITVTGNAIAKTGSLFKIETGTSANGYSNAPYIDRYAVDFRNGKALYFGAQTGASTPYRYLLSYLKADASTPTLITQQNITLGISAPNGSRLVRFLRDDLALACWYNDSSLFWRLLRLEGTGVTQLGFGSSRIYGTSVSHNVSRLQLFVLSENTVAAIIAGTDAQYPKIIFGTVLVDNADMNWSEWTELPFITKYSGYITGAYDAAKKTFAIVEHNGSTAPLMLTVKL